jgi:hypothetical protein
MLGRREDVIHAEWPFRTGRSSQFRRNTLIVPVLSFETHNDGTSARDEGDACRVFRTRFPHPSFPHFRFPHLGGLAFVHGFHD